MTDSLEDLHRQIEDITAPDGDFAVVCPRSGKCPVPVRGQSFPSADAAEEAVDLVREYRTLLREVDPHLENIPIVATERAADPLALETSEPDGRPDDGRRRQSRLGRAVPAADSPRTVTLSGEGDAEWLRMDGAPVVDVRRDGEPLDDATVSRQLRSALR